MIDWSAGLSQLIVSCCWESIRRIRAIDFFTAGSGCIRSIACDIRTALFSIPFMRMIRVRV